MSLPQEIRSIFVIKAAMEMQNNLPLCDKKFTEKIEKELI
jgi:hypothetical protein